MAASAYIEDKKARLTIVTAQPLGVASMVPGQLEVSQIILVHSYLITKKNVKN